MKKTLFTSVFALILGVSAFADNEPTVLPDNATCNEDNLGVSSGSADIEIAWEANTIGTTWYKDGVQITGDDVPSSCTYDTAMNLPEPPSKPGYVFDGWTLMAPPCVLPTLATTDTGTDYGFINGSSPEPYASNALTYGLTQPQTWGATMLPGKITGSAICSALAGNNHNWEWGAPSADWTSNATALNAETGDKVACWCHIEGYTANSSNACEVTSTPWVYLYSFRSATDCLDGCASDCAQSVRGDLGYRAALYGN